MSSNAEEYATSIASDIRENVAKGIPFGEDGEREEYGEPREISAMDYLEGVLDIQYLVSASREYIGARILIAFGGPNAWIDTQKGTLEVTWWSAPVVESLPEDFTRELDEALEELWGMGA